MRSACLITKARTQHTHLTFYTHCFSTTRAMRTCQNVTLYIQCLAPPGTTTSSITTHTPSGQGNCASWASQPQKSVTLLPCPGGRTTKSTKDMWWHWRKKTHSLPVFLLVGYAFACSAPVSTATTLIERSTCGQFATVFVLTIFINTDIRHLLIIIIIIIIIIISKRAKHTI